ncbi:hypothetical protein OE09_2488 [Flavobacteriaceae bacterium MAR_2010_72]|nr:hypothetical protein OE09_2488 [Flavobacteriaceae bacterium MAR_2010_72]TVZ58810.1 hypothetical protein NA63_1318 [Flavobacteriaceae bacterium MAR_2010_105]
MFNYNDKIFKVLKTTINGETTEDTIFNYKQTGNILTSKYSGGNILEGHLIGLVSSNGEIDIRYHQINLKGDLMTGVCKSIPEVLKSGKIRLHEQWQWTSGDKSKGNSIIEEI